MVDKVDNCAWAFIFPGQGAQSLGMLSAYREHAVVRETVQTVASAIDVDLPDIIEKDGDALNETINTQPCLLAMGVGVFRSLADHLPVPTVLAGHSLGEYSALVCAGYLSLTDAAKLVRYRAELMQSTVANGGMAAILGLDVAQIESICEDARQAGESIWPANFNSPTQTVVAGYRASLEKYAEVFKQSGAKRVVILPMSVPSHCPLLQPAVPLLKQALQATPFTNSGVKILHTAQSTNQQQPFAEYLSDIMSQQLVQPVNWVGVLKQMNEMGVEKVIEMGPGKILSALGKNILGKNSGVEHIAINNADALEQFKNQGEQ